MLEIRILVILSTGICTQRAYGKYMFFNESKSWEDANTTCSTECKGNLTSWDEELQNTVKRQIPNVNTLWIGKGSEIDPEIVKIGCIQDINTLLYEKIGKIRNNNAHTCRMFCSDYKAFGIKGNKCICRRDTDEIKVICSDSNRVTSRCLPSEYTVYTYGTILRCNMDNCECQWTQNTSKHLIWMTGESSPQGNYVVLEKINEYGYSIGSAQGNISFSVKTTTQTNKMCLSFTYLLQGMIAPNVDVVIATERNNDFNQTIHAWRTVGGQMGKWINESVNIKFDQPLKSFKIMFVGTFPEDLFQNIDSRIAIDDIHITHGSCINYDVSTCYYESEHCDWIENSDEDLLWIRFRVPASLNPTGKEQYFLRTDASFMNSGTKGSVANLTSPIIRPKEDNRYCLRFWYRMNGHKQDRLNISVKQMHEMQNIWERQGTYSDKWYEEHIDLQSSFTFAIIIEAATYDNTGDISISHISLEFATCDGGRLSWCNFDSDLCGWSKRGNKKSQWSFHKRETKNVYGDGSYIRIKTQTNWKMNDSAQLVSKRIFTSNINNYCLTFFYNIFDDGTSSLRIYTEQLDGVTKDLVLNSETDFLEKNWYRKSISIVSRKDFYIVFEVKKAEHEDGYIALDNITVSTGSCGKGYDLEEKCPFIDQTKNGKMHFELCDEMGIEHRFICALKTLPKLNNACQGLLLNASFGTNNSFDVFQSTAAFSEEVDATSHLHHPTSTGFTAKSSTFNSVKVAPIKAGQSSSSNDKGLITVIGVLAAVCILLLLLLVFVFLKYRRFILPATFKTQSGKTNNNDPTRAMSNLNYEYGDDVELSSNQRQNCADETHSSRSYKAIDNKTNADFGGYELARNTQKDNVYQNTDIKIDTEGDYIGIGEGDYDHIGKSSDRRKENMETSEPTYDHAVESGKTANKENDYDFIDKSSNKGELDSTDVGDNYFVLEQVPRTTSHIYDHRT